MVAVTLVAPLVEGFHEHVAVIFGDVPVAALLTHPAIFTPFALN